jgi:hypothetical protein
VSDGVGLAWDTGRWAGVVVGYGMLADDDAARAAHRPLPLIG